jgi:hypothetical protein
MVAFPADGWGWGAEVSTEVDASESESVLSNRRLRGS